MKAGGSVGWGSVALHTRRMYRGWPSVIFQKPLVYPLYTPSALVLVHRSTRCHAEGRIVAALARGLERLLVYGGMTDGIPSGAEDKPGKDPGLLELSLTAI